MSTTGKPTRTAEQLRAMVQVRLYARPEIQRRLSAGLPNELLPIIDLPQARTPDAMGRNWEIARFRNIEGLEVVVQSLVDSVRDAYDIVG